jgi:2-C-methyl-D-erythritol 2,4-cyclodiphosphate synthase
VNVFRVGFGYDAHRLVEGRSLILGGVKIPHQLGLLGHSDADVLTHAIVDAILGALVKGDMGQHFPDSDPAYKDMDSLLMLRKVMEWVKEDGFRVNQVDTTIVAEAPRPPPVRGWVFAAVKMVWRPMPWSASLQTPHPPNYLHQ